jgi:hypothetical protein
MLKNLLLINAALRILFLREPHPGSVHDKRSADPTPYPLPTGSHLLQDTGLQAFTLEVNIRLTHCPLQKRRYFPDNTFAKIR